MNFFTRRTINLILNTSVWFFSDVVLYFPIYTSPVYRLAKTREKHALKTW